MAGYGPDCPHCGTNAEWTQGEIDEAIFGAKTYCCSNCYGFYVLTAEEVEKYQQAAQALQNPSGTNEFQAETEEDWLKARELYEKGEPDNGEDCKFLPPPPE